MQLPDKLGLVLAPSKIQDAGLGVFATQYIPKATYLGRYIGKRYTEQQFQKAVLNGQTTPAYAFDVNSGSRHFILDAVDSSTGNHTRYFNCSRNDREENVVYTDSEGKIRFYARRNIHPGEELMFYYGEIYAHRLGIKYQSSFYDNDGYECNCSNCLSDKKNRSSTSKL